MATQDLSKINNRPNVGTIDDAMVDLGSQMGLDLGRD